MHLDSFIQSFGYLGLVSIIFAETGLMLGFFLPGDSVLFTAGFLASQGVFDITTLCILMFLAATVGNTVGYYFGHHVGKRLFKKEDSLLFHKDHIVRARTFYETHGGKALILARFLPVVRTFVPIAAGVGGMKITTFTLYNVIGALLWAVALPVLGFYLGKTIPDVDKYLLPIVGLIVIVSLAPTAIHILKEKENRHKIIHLTKRIIRREK